MARQADAIIAARDDPAHARADDGLDAGRGPAHVIARLEGDVKGRASRTGSRLSERLDTAPEALARL